MSHLSIKIASGDIFSAQLSMLLDILSNLKQSGHNLHNITKVWEQMV